MSTLQFTLPVPPTTNKAYFNSRGRGPGRRLTDEAREYKGRVVSIATGHALIKHWRYESGARLAVTLRLWFADKRGHGSRDLANCEKLLVDSTATALGFNDKVIDRLLLIREGVDKANPRCEVTIERIGGE